MLSYVPQSMVSGHLLYLGTYGFFVWIDLSNNKKSLFKTVKTVLPWSSSVAALAPGPEVIRAFSELPLMLFSSSLRPGSGM